MSRRRIPSPEAFTVVVASVAPRPGAQVGASRRLGADLGFTLADLLELDIALYERFGGTLGLDGRSDDWLGRTVGEAYELCVERSRRRADRHELALANDVRRAILGLIGDGEMTRGELRAGLGDGLAPGRLDYHLAVLEEADLIRADGGRWWRCGTEG